jgi:hypothetical protein
VGGRDAVVEGGREDLGDAVGDVGVLPAGCGLAAEAEERRPVVQAGISPKPGLNVSWRTPALLKTRTPAAVPLVVVKT